jgi:hypothetical protein
VDMGSVFMILETFHVKRIMACHVTTCVVIALIRCQGMWLSGRAFASHVKGPGFNPRHLQFAPLV